MAYNYVQTFLTQLQQKYTRELTSYALTTESTMFIGTKTVRIPRLDVAGYKNHSRAGGWNRQAIGNDFETKELTFDRDVEFFVDTMDVDETNQVLSAGNTTNVFETEQAIPELDKYRYSKIYADYVALGKTPDVTVLTTANALQVFDKLMQNMDEAELPLEGRLLYVTPTTYTLLKQAQDMQRFINVQGNNGMIDRTVRKLDDVTLVQVPSSRMKTVFDFTNGAVPGVGAKQINMILIHPHCVIAPIKHAAIYLWEPGSHTQGDGYLYQNRKYTDLFLIQRKVDAIQINVAP